LTKFRWVQPGSPFFTRAAKIKGIPKIALDPPLPSRITGLLSVNGKGYNLFLMRAVAKKNRNAKAAMPARVSANYDGNIQNWGWGVKANGEFEKESRRLCWRRLFIGGIAPDPD
jgi:hypothetical protein